MDLEDITLNERNKTQKVIKCVVLLIHIAQNRQIHNDRKYISGFQGAEGKYEVAFWSA